MKCNNTERTQHAGLGVCADNSLVSFIRRGLIRAWDPAFIKIKFLTLEKQVFSYISFS